MFQIWISELKLPKVGDGDVISRLIKPKYVFLRILKLFFYKKE